MNLRFYIICTAALITLLASASLTLGVPFLEDKNVTATVHGVAYARDTLEPLKDTVVGINSTPPQSMVAKDGMYSFELVPGDYTITARYYQNNTIVYSKEATFRIESEGNYVFDLLLYPVSEYPVTEPISAKIKNPESPDPPEQTSPSIISHLLISYLSVAFALLLLLGGGYKFSSKHKNTNKNGFQEGKFGIPGIRLKLFGKSTSSGLRPENPRETVSVPEPIIEPAGNPDIETAALKTIPLSTELREVLDIIRGHKGRITQKDLRSRLEYSEVKVSLMLSELEKRGMIQKLRNGRENIVVLVDEER
ncbi:helix-turn-helix transcriptional regulator [Methanosarcina sp. T3]|uniref:helix-turn-helix transcriptional regulator n=1 Tax=Methanosarcina sp. T3 TaxID=3439062 RepID=UPI003F85FF91